MLVFSLTAPAAEAVRSKSSSSRTAGKKRSTGRSSIRKTRTPRIRKIRAPRIRKIRAPRIRKIRAPRVRTHRVPRLTARQQAAARIAAAHQAEAARIVAAQAIARQQAEAARIAAIRQQRIAAWNAAAPIREQFKAAWDAVKPAFLASGFENHMIVQRLTTANQPSPYAQCDLGYQGLPTPARTAQYGIGMPAATVFHPYYMEENTRDYQTPAFFLNVRFPGYRSDFGPEVLHQHLVDINPANIEMVLIIHDSPWTGNLQVKPQGWLNPNAPYQNPLPHSDIFYASVGVFSKQPNGPHIQGQLGDDLIENHCLSIHNGRDEQGIFHPALVSSGNTLLLMNFNTNNLNQCFSVVKHGGKAQIVQQVSLPRLDAEAFSQELAVSGNLNALKARLQAIQAAGVRFQDLDINELW